jgi:hypothetical protein
VDIRDFSLAPAHCDFVILYTDSSGDEKNLPSEHKYWFLLSWRYFWSAIPVSYDLL